MSKVKKVLVVIFITFPVLFGFILWKSKTGLKINGIITESMAPICPRGSLAFVWPYYYPGHMSRFPDIIIYKTRLNTDFEYIGRQVAGGNQKVAIYSNIFYINGFQYDKFITIPGSFLQNGQEKEITNDEVFILNDNRNKTSDSRNFGTVPKNLITGKITRCLKNRSFWEVIFYKIVDSSYILNVLFKEPEGF